MTFPPAGDLKAAASVLRAGGLVAFPTETVYGLGADATNEAAVRRIFEVKARPADHPLIVHLGSADVLDEWAEDIAPAARLLADVFWPGPLTMVLRRSARVPDIVTGGRETVGLRVPDHPVARALLDSFAGAVAAPSANRFGRVSPTTADHVRADLGPDVDLVLDGGACAVGVESTIVDLSAGRIEVLRSGGVSLDRLAEVLGTPPDLWAGDGPARAPGMLASHYAPLAAVVVLAAEHVVDRAAEHLAANRMVGVLAPMAFEGLPDGVIELEPAGEAEEYARLLYARLRQADRLGIDVLLVVAPPEHGVGVAVGDRLRRAAATRGPR